MKWILTGAFSLLISFAYGHDIYTGVHGKNGQLCCGGDDCSATIYKFVNGNYEFRTREGFWITVPEERITFLPIPGETPDNDHYAHLCYRKATDYDKTNNPQSVIDDVFLYCAFIPPGGV